MEVVAPARRRTVINAIRAEGLQAAAEAPERVKHSNYKAIAAHADVREFE